MFEGRFTLKPQEIFAASAAVFVMACMVSTPALAANISRIPCVKAIEATLQDPIHVLVAEAVGHDISVSSENSDAAIVKIEIASSSSVLAPRAEAAIREAFRDRADERSAEPKQATVNSPPMVDADPTPESATDKGSRLDAQSELNTKLPGISDDDLSQYRKRMYRRDI